MFEEIRCAITGVPRDRLPELTAAMWKAFAAGGVTEAEAEELSLAIEARKAVGATQSPAGGLQRGRATFPVRKPQRPPVRSVAVERRRRLAASGPMPPALAARFTTGELAVLRIVADEVTARGSCCLCLDAIAARAGVSRTKAKQALRQARGIGMLEVRERRRTGGKSLPNVVTIVDREWLAWMKRGSRIGGRNSPTTDTRGFREGEGRAVQPHRTAERNLAIQRASKIPSCSIQHRLKR